MGLVLPVLAGAVGFLIGVRVDAGRRSRLCTGELVGDTVDAMLRTWVFDTVAVTVSEIDFEDPATPGERELGVRLEVCPVTTTFAGSIYTSAVVTLEASVCRVDLLESAPGAADRMHWHPSMSAGEPEDRVFDVQMAEDPRGWLTDQLHDVARLVDPDGTSRDAASFASDAAAVASLAPEIVDAAMRSLDRMRRPWPASRHDERGLAVVGPG